MSSWRSRLAHLPREARDTLFLLAAIAATVLPHAEHLPAWCTALTALMLLWRGQLAWRGAALPGRWSLSLMLLLTAGLTLLTHRSLLGREPGITMLVMLMALKTLELRARRDAFVVFFLGFFLVLTQYLYSQSLLTGLWTLVSVWGLLSALVLAQMPVGQPSLGLAGRLAARTTLMGLPVMVLLFALFPRIAPLWGVPSDAVGKTGLSNELQFGAMGEIANDDSVALRLRFEGAPPPPQALYFRGPVLSRFDGRAWRALIQPGPWAARDPGPRTRGQVLRYELTLEPLRLSVLPLLESGAEAPGTKIEVQGQMLWRGSELQWMAQRPITERLRLTQQAWLDYDSGPTQDGASLQPYRELPPGLNPRTRAWAQALRQRPEIVALAPVSQTPALVAAVLRHIATADFTYTLVPGRYGEATPHLIDEFWFDRKLGFCEHFAAGFVVVMRALDIPARIVTGFQGADRELQDGYLVVRNAQAHAWAEVWHAGRGWVRVDPTAAVAPERVSQSRTLQPAPGLLSGALGQMSPAMWQNLRQGWEILNNRWQQYVLNYSRNDQFDLLKSLGWSTPDWQSLGQLVALLMAGLAAIGAGFAAWQAREHGGWARQRAAILRELRALDIPAAAAHQAPRQWAALLRARHGAEAEQLARQLLALELARYAAHDLVPEPGPLARWRWLREFRAAGRMLRAQIKKPA